MDHSATPTASSTITTQGPGPPPGPGHGLSISGPTAALPPAQVLEISLISAQDLTPLNKSMRTYAVAWLDPNQKVTTRTDQHHTNPTWNDKFTFNVDVQALFSVNAALQVEIYTVSWFRHVLVGTVKVLVNDLLAPAIRGSPQHSTRFVALQVRRPSGTPQGILNLGITFHDHSLRAMLRQHHSDNLSEVYGKAGPGPGPDQGDESDAEFRKKIQMWRRSASESEIHHHDFPLKTGSVTDGSVITGSVCNGSMVNGSELCSDIGPSASIVAADLAMKMQPPPPVVRRQIVRHVDHPVRHVDADDSRSSVVEELTMQEAIAKGYIVRAAGERYRRVVYDGDESELSAMNHRHSRRNSDGGLFSCFVAGIEFRIACGAGPNPAGNRHGNAAGAARRKDLH